MRNNKFYYLVGLEGAGKTTVSKQLANSVYGGITIKTSSRFIEFIKNEGIETLKDLDLMNDALREDLINKFHHSFIEDKKKSDILYLDGHMYVDNLTTGCRVNAMASDNKGVLNGIIYLNTPAEIIVNNVKNDNDYNVRCRKIKSIDTIKDLSEKEFQAAENYCLKNNIEFGLLNNTTISKKFIRKSTSDIIYLNKYYLPQSIALRNLYFKQFRSDISPSDLRKQHHKIGELLVNPFLEKTKLNKNDYQVISMDRSGNYITNGFINDFDGMFCTYKESFNSNVDIGDKKVLIIIDSVMDSGKTIKDIVNKISKLGTYDIHVICLAINVKSLSVIESLKGKVEFHCLGFSNKEDRPKGKGDMGARLYGTEK